MNCNELLLNYINKRKKDEPIFIDEIKKYFKALVSDYDDVFLKTVNVYINRLVKNGKIKQYAKGIYYKPSKGYFGYKKIDVNKVIYKKYLRDNKVKGYYSGAYLFNQLGLTTQVPKEVLIVTNECKNNNKYNNKNLRIVIKKPKIKITEDNYKYLQLFDLLTNKDKIKIEVSNKKDIILKFINDNNLDMVKAFEYANKIGDMKPIINFYYLMGEKNE